LVVLLEEQMKEKNESAWLYSTSNV
jgi:hypothetical protein